MDGGQSEQGARGRQSSSKRGEIVEGRGDADARRTGGKTGRGSKGVNKGKGNRRTKGSGPKGEAEKSGGKGGDSVEIKILSWNVDGFRERARQLLILSCLWGWRVDIAIITESRLRGEDIFFGPPGSNGEESKGTYKLQMNNYSK